MTPLTTLRAIKVVHTIIWAFFAACILAIPVAVFAGNLKAAWLLIGVVLVEVVILLAYQMRCPLTIVAARYTSERQDNFDIYLPLWLARHNKQIFGWLFVAGMVCTIVASFGLGLV